MTTPGPSFAPHIRLTARGVFGSAVNGAYEEWSYGFSLGTGTTVSVPSQTQVQAWATSLQEFHGRPASFFSLAHRMTEVKAARIGADGQYTDDPIIIGMNTPGGQPTEALVYPPQVALAVSLNTNRRGASGRGRFYLPCPHLALGNDGLITANDATSMRGSLQTLLNLLNNVSTTPQGDAYQLVVASSKGFLSGVTHFRLGRAFDTMRSRRRSLPETYGAEQAIN